MENYDNGNTKHPYGHALVAGIENYPQRVKRSMSGKKISKRSRITPFIKVINYNHLMPTRYSVDLGEKLKSGITAEAFRGSDVNPEARITSRRAVKKLFEDRYNSGKNKWFFTRLAF